MQNGNLFQPSAPFHAEIIYLICSTSQVTGICMKYNTGLKWVNKGLTS